MGVERRVSPRVAVSIDGQCERLGTRRHHERVMTIDLSDGGAAIEASSRLGVGDVVVLTLELGDDHAIACRGLVVGCRSTAPGKVTANVAFATLEDHERSLLRDLVTAELA